MTKEALDDRDCYPRPNKQAALLRAGKIDEIEIANPAEEIECSGRRNERVIFCLHRAILSPSIIGAASTTG